MSNYFADYFRDSADVINSLQVLETKLLVATNEIIGKISSGGKVFWFGNGGSASDAQHLAAELVGRFEKNRRPIASIALNTDTSALTAIANDFGFSTIFKRQIEALACENDVVIGISTSGKSENVLLGLEAAQNLGALTIGLTGSVTGLISPFCSHTISVDSARTCHIQEAHIAIGQSMCGLIEDYFIG
jgi:D-sedoheptulose 7-phosphate isomerase